MRLRSSNCAIRSPPQITLSPPGLPLQRCSATSASALTNPRAWCIAKARRCVALAVGRAGGAQFLLQLVDQYDRHVRHDRHALPVDVLSFVYDPTAPTPEHRSRPRPNALTTVAVWSHGGCAIASARRNAGVIVGYAMQSTLARSRCRRRRTGLSSTRSSASHRAPRTAAPVVATN